MTASLDIHCNSSIVLDSQCLCHEPYRRKYHSLKTHGNQDQEQPGRIGAEKCSSHLFSFRGKTCCLKVGGPLKELDIGFRRVFCIFYSVFPLSTDSGNSKVCVSAKAGVILLVLGPGDPGATDSKHQDASPCASPRKITKLPLLHA